MIKSLLRIALVVVLAVVSTISTAVAANARDTDSYWNVRSDPLVVAGYGSTGKAYGYIYMHNGSNGTRMHSRAWDRFSDTDNHQVYTENQAQFNAGTCSTWTIGFMFKGVMVNSSTYCAQQYFDYGLNVRINGLNYTTSVWTAMPNWSSPVRAGADRGRMAVNLRLDVPWRHDPISGPSYSDPDSF